MCKTRPDSVRKFSFAIGLSGAFRGLPSFPKQRVKIEPLFFRLLLGAFAIALAAYEGLYAAPVVNAVLNGASFAQGSLAPGTLVSVFGTGLASDVFVPQQLPLPTELGGTRASLNGIAMPLFFVSPTQINAQLPFGLPDGNAVLVVQDATGSQSSVAVTVGAASPGVFTVTADGQGNAIATHLDFSLVQPTLTTNASIGEAIVLFCTGLGDVNNFSMAGAAAPSSPLATTKLQPDVLMDGRPAQVLFSGLAPGFVGLYQINLVVPEGVGGNVHTTIRIGDIVSNEVLINVAGVFSLHSAYSGAMTLRFTREVFLLEFFNLRALSDMRFTGEFAVSNQTGGLVDAGTLEMEAGIPFVAVLHSDLGDTFDVFLDTLDAGESFVGIILNAGDSPENWFAEFDVSRAPPPTAPPPPDALPGVPAECQVLEGALIFADDGTFLGEITSNTFAHDSIGNEFGPYGSEFSRTSIFNEFGRYGSQFSAQSAFNEFASRPPVVYINGRAVAFLTVNEFKTPRIDPRSLFPCIGN